MLSNIFTSMQICQRWPICDVTLKVIAERLIIRPYVSASACRFIQPICTEEWLIFCLWSHLLGLSYVWRLIHCGLLRLPQEETRHVPLYHVSTIFFIIYVPLLEFRVNDMLISSGSGECGGSLRIIFNETSVTKIRGSKPKISKVKNELSRYTIPKPVWYKFYSNITVN
jgi:hypothetical protein